MIKDDARAAEDGEVTRPERPVARRGVKPFDWRRLPRCSRAAVEALRALGLGSAENTRAAIEEILARDLGVPCGLRFVGASSSAETAALSRPGCFLLVELAPDAPPVIVDVDLRAALAWSARLVGAGAAFERPALLRPLATVERAALTYLSLRVADRIAQSASDLAPRILGIRDAIDEALLFGDGGVAATFDVTLGAVTGPVRVYVPRALLPRVARRRRGEASTDGPRCIPVTLAVELARTQLRPSDLESLARGDVVVLANAAPADEHRAWLRVVGGRASIRVRIDDGPDGPWATILSPATTDEAFAMNETKTPGETLLADARIPVTVELARLELAAEEVMGLRVGDTLLLHREPGALLDLVAGGRAIARGELVEVEGELGLRIVQLRP